MSDKHLTELDIVESTFNKDADPLPLRDFVCKDCAVKTGFYLSHSNACKKLDKDRQLEISKRWFCHNDCDKACRGNANNLNLEW